jgi:hypothetical protein
MNDERLDQALGQVFQTAFGVSREQEDALWSHLARRRQQEAHAWSGFRAVMLQANAGVRQAIAWAVWPAQGVPGIA